MIACGAGTLVTAVAVEVEVSVSIVEAAAVLPLIVVLERSMLSAPNSRIDQNPTGKPKLESLLRMQKPSAPS